MICHFCQSPNPKFQEEENYKNNTFCNTNCQSQFYIGLYANDNVPTDIIIVQLRWLSFEDLYTAYKTNRRMRNIILYSNVFLTEWLASFPAPLKDKREARQFIAKIDWSTEKKRKARFILINDIVELDFLEYALQFPVFNPSNDLFHIAITLGNTRAVELLLPKIDPSTDDIVLAAAHGHLEILKILIATGKADPYANDNYALMSAAGRGHLEIVKFLFNDSLFRSKRIDTIFGVATNHFSVFRFLMEKGLSPSEMKRDYIIANVAENNNLEFIKYLILEKKFKSVSAIVRAASAGRLEIVKFLFENGADLHVENDSAFSFSAANGQLEVVKFLMENGVKPTRFGVSNALGNGHIDVIKYILPSIDPFEDNNYLIKRAAWKGNKEMIEFFFEKYGELYTQELFDQLIEIANDKNDAAFMRFLQFAIDKIKSKGAAEGRVKRFKILNKVF